MGRIIDFNKPAPITVCSYGPSGSGKTRFAASFPRPLFLSDATEQGWTTIGSIPPEVFWEKDKRPEVHAVESIRDLTEEVEALIARVKAKPGEIQTAVVDSLTFLTNMYADAFSRAQSESDKKDNWAVYKALASYVRGMLSKLHSLGLNVVWLALERAGDEGALGGIAIPGASATIVPAACQYWFYHRSFTQGNELKFEIRTKRFGAWQARCRSPLPDPMEPTYRAMQAHLIGGVK